MIHSFYESKSFGDPLPIKLPWAEDKGEGPDLWAPLMLWSRAFPEIERYFPAIVQDHLRENSFLGRCDIWSFLDED